jgi:general secretion pathway protein J
VLQQAQQKQHQGFTLLEVMVALGIFALIGTACYQLLHSMNVSRATLQAASDHRADVLKALLIIEQDMRHLIPRSVRSENSEKRLAALSSGGEGVLEFSRGGFPLQRSIVRDSARRVSYRMEQEQGQPVLYRVVYEVLDRVEASPFYRQVLLADIADLGFRFMDNEGRWMSVWPPVAKDSEAEDDTLAELPLAIEVAITLSMDQTLQRMISLR